MSSVGDYGVAVDIRGNTMARYTLDGSRDSSC